MFLYGSNQLTSGTAGRWSDAAMHAFGRKPKDATFVSHARPEPHPTT